jgi:hypothetical protein
MKRDPYPLQWPPRLPRTKHIDRRRSSFGGRGGRDALSPHATGKEVIDEIARLGATTWVITSNLPSRGPEGIPFADAPRGDDPGIAVWFEYRRVERGLACDRWFRPEENLRSIAKTIEAMRGLERWGVADVMASVFTGFAAALPPGDPVEPVVLPWRDVLGGSWPAGLGAEDTLALAKARHRRLMEGEHIDAGGSSDRMLDLNLALEAAKIELGG